MQTSKRPNRREKIVQCEFVGCTNKFTQRHHREIYCKDPCCIEARKLLRPPKKRCTDPDADNLKITTKLASGQTLLIRCSAQGVNGQCNRAFRVTYDKKRTIYPKYCSLHRNAYKRKRFQTVRMQYAESKRC